MRQNRTNIAAAVAAISFDPQTGTETKMKLKHWLRIGAIGLFASLALFGIFRLMALTAAVAFWSALALGVVVAVVVLFKAVCHATGRDR